MGAPPRTRAARAARLARAQPALVGLLAAGAAAVLAAGLTAAVRGGETRAFDRAVLRALRDGGRPADGLGPPWVAEAAAEFTALGGKAVIPAVAVLAAGFLVLTRRPFLAAGLIACVAGAAVVAFLLKDLTERPRPPTAWRLRDAHTTAAFPSAHAALATVAYVTLIVVVVLAAGRMFLT